MHRKVLTFLLTLLLLSTLVFGVNASTGAKQIEVTYRDISVLMNGQEMPSTVEPFIFEGRTFVPLRFVAEALSKNVTWDEDLSQVRIANPLLLGANFDQKSIFLSTGQVFSVILDGNPTTGYTWEIQDYDSSVLKPIGEPLYQTSATTTVPLMGQGGTFTFSFITLGKVSETTLKLVYHRTWEASPPEKEFSLAVQVIDQKSPLALADKDNGCAVYVVKPVQELMLSLEGNPSTGYAWEIVGGDGQIIALADEPIFEPDSEALGAPGHYTFKFEPQNPGQTIVKLIYTKTGEDLPLKEYQFLVGVF